MNVPALHPKIISIMEWNLDGAKRLFIIVLLCISATNAYQMYFLEDASVCTSTKRTIKMNAKSTSLKIHLSKYPYVTSLPMDCHLEIEAPKNQGLQVVVEDINLRRNPLDDQCDDYVWFGRDEDGTLSQKLCGQRKLVPTSRVSRDSQEDQAEDSPYLVKSLIPEGPNATTFLDPGGELHIWFRKTSRNVEKHLQPLRLVVLVTAYKQTCKTNDSSFWSCSPEGDPSLKYQEKCIPMNLKCDGHINCGAGLFSDESDCAPPSLLSGGAISTVSLVVLGSVALLLFCLMASMVCFCRRRSARSRRSRRSQEECRVATVPTHPAEGVAMERWRAAAPKDDSLTKEDPPPSYSELFPNYAPVPQRSTDSN